MSDEKNGMTEEAKRLRDESGAADAAAYLCGLPDRNAALKGFNELVIDTYWQRKDAAATREIAEAGIDYSLRTAKAVVENDDALAAMQTAKMLTFNLASFCWTGWDEPGIELTPDLIDAGRRAAEKNAALVREMHLGPIPHARAHWMLGGFALTDGRYTNAAALFDQSAAFARSGESVGESLLAEGFACLARSLGGSAEDGARLETVKDQLRRVEDGEGFIQQIETAERACRRAFTA